MAHSTSDSEERRRRGESHEGREEKFPERCTQISLPPSGSDDAYYSRAYIQQVSQSGDAKELGLACRKMSLWLGILVLIERKLQGDPSHW